MQKFLGNAVVAPRRPIRIARRWSRRRIEATLAERTWRAGPRQRAVLSRLLSPPRTRNVCRPECVAPRDRRAADPVAALCGARRISPLRRRRRRGVRWSARTWSGERSARIRSPRNCGRCSIACWSPPRPRSRRRFAEIDALFAALARESRDPGPGAPAMTALYLGLLLMHLWRACGLARASDVLGAARRRAAVPPARRTALSRQSRRRRILAHARRHARAIFTSACVRALGSAPQRLVHERLNVEARMRLRETGQTIEQIAYGLGFRDPAYFSRFFSRRSGMSPGAYRNAMRVAPPREATSFAAWP